MAKILYVDIKHPSGHVELRHKVELAQHSRQTEDQQVEDHLRVKPCPKTLQRGGWKWAYSAPVAEPKAKAKGAPVAEPQPKA